MKTTSGTRTIIPFEEFIVAMKQLDKIEEEQMRQLAISEAFCKDGVLYYRGFEITQSSHNFHIWIHKNGEFLAHIRCDCPKSIKELCYIADEQIELVQDTSYGEIF